MTENDVVDGTKHPITVDSLVGDLERIGVGEGTVLFVQSSLSSIGWVCGGAVAVIQALLNTIGDEGTLVMPCMSSDWSDPSRWENPPVPMGWWDIIKDCMPPFDKDVTPARKMGAVANAFRCWPGVVRSDHPISFIAGGKHSRYVVEGQPLSFPMGAGSPLERCCEMDGYGLLIGTERNTTLHLAEYRACFTKKTVKNGVPMIRNGRREWCEYEEYEDYTEHFPKILSEFSGTGRCKMGMIGNAKSHLFKQSDIVDYGKEWFERNLN